MAETSSKGNLATDFETRNVKRKSSADSSLSSWTEKEPDEPRKKLHAEDSPFKSKHPITDDSKCLKRKVTTAPISLKLGVQKSKEAPSVVKTSSASVAKAFNMEEDDDEEMPPEAKMRMKNVGRDTPTSAGPNSFGKTRQGFCDTKKMFEKQTKKTLEESK